MPFASNITVSSTSGVLSALYSFVIVTLSWTPVASGISGIGVGFVAKSSGVSGDRNIYLKFGASIADQAAISVFGATNFLSATSVASYATTDKRLSTSNEVAITIWMEGDKDHVFIGTQYSATATISSWLYAGLTKEFNANISTMPNRVVLATSFDMEKGSAKIVEGAIGTYNISCFIGSLDTAAFLNRSDPSLTDSNVYMFPVVVADAITDRVYGTLINAYAVGTAISQTVSLTASAVDYTVFRSFTTAAVGGLAVKNTA